MKWFDRWFYKQTKKAWDNKDLYESDVEQPKVRGLNMATAGQLAIGRLEKSSPEGEDRINFELTSAVGGRILNVRRYDERKDHHTTTTYVIPSGEDVGARVAKILNLELLK